MTSRVLQAIVDELEANAEARAKMGTRELQAAWEPWNNWNPWSNHSNYANWANWGNFPPHLLQAGPSSLAAPA